MVAFSSGNHAQGVAAAAQILNMQATIVMPIDSPLTKRERTKGYGAEVVLYDRDKEDREAIANGIASKRGATLVRPYDDLFVIAGQGTAGREIAEDMAALGIVARHRGGAGIRRRPDRGCRHRREGKISASPDHRRRAQGL